MSSLNIVGDTDERELVREVLYHGLKMEPSLATTADVLQQLKFVRLCLNQRSRDQVSAAIRYGMKDVWPFSEDGRAWDARDLYKNLLRAVAAVGSARRRGDIPFNAQTGEVDL